MFEMVKFISLLAACIMLSATAHAEVKSTINHKNDAAWFAIVDSAKERSAARNHGIIDRITHVGPMKEKPIAHRPFGTSARISI